MMFRKSWRGVLLAGAIVLAGGAASASEQMRVAVVVGNNQGNVADRTLRYAEQEVGRLADIFREQGSFDSMQVLRGASRHEVELALRTARAKLDEAKAKNKETLFLFYYSGHGDNEALELGATRLALRDLRSYLETLPADVRLAFVDACQSGALTGVKGGKRAPSYEVRLADPGTVRGMAIITSSTANELSQESDDLKGSYFSHSIMTGLRGAADVRRDGQVTLSELYQYAFRRTLANTAASLIGGQHPTYDYQMAGTGDVVLTRTQTKDAQLAFPREKGVTYTVLAAGEVTAELPSSFDEDVYLALPAGEYKVVRRAMANVKETRVKLEPGAAVTVDPAVMIAVPVELLALRKKGGRFETPNLLGASAGVQTPVTPGAPSVVGAVGVAYTRAVGWGALRLRADLSKYDAGGATAASGQDVSTLSTSLFRITPTVDLLLPLFDKRRIGLFVGPSVGLPLLWQRESRLVPTAGDPTALDDGAFGFSVGATYQAMSTLAVRIVDGLQVAINASAGAETIPVLTRGGGSELRTRPTFGASLGIARAF